MAGKCEVIEDLLFKTTAILEYKKGLRTGVNVKRLRQAVVGPAPEAVEEVPSEVEQTPVEESPQPLTNDQEETVEPVEEAIEEGVKG